MVETVLWATQAMRLCTCNESKKKKKLQNVCCSLFSFAYFSDCGTTKKNWHFYLGCLPKNCDAESNNVFFAVITQKGKAVGHLLVYKEGKKTKS